MFRWIPYTFVRIVAFLIAGIITGIYWPGLVSTSVMGTLLVVLAVFYFGIVFIKKSQSKVFNPGIVGLPLIFIAGYLHVTFQTETNNSDHLMHLSQPVQYYRVVINSFSEEKQNSWKVEGKVLDVYTNTWRHVTGKVMLYFAKQDFTKPFNYGDILLIKGSPQILQSPGNPGEFDYKRFLTFRNIYHQHFLKKNNVQFLTHDPPIQLIHYSLSARAWANAVLKKHISGQREQAIIAALILGVTDGLDNELLNAYAATGAMHVLAVSGLHVSIIYVIILWLLKPLNANPSGRLTVALISLLLLWSYAFVTGLSPSVLRAVTMFTFIALARPLSLGTNIYNTLAGSAFCLLLYDPYLIMSVGFQLSYLAVLGIVYLYPRLIRLFEPTTYLGVQIWKITCVSLAAQIATFSLGLLYFHQFPNYFLLSNLLVIPIANGVLIGGILLLATSVIPVIATGIGFLLHWAIKFLNLIVFGVESLPLSLIEDIYITTLQCWLLIGLIIAIILIFETKKFAFVWMSVVFTVCFAFLQWRHDFQHVSVDKFTVYKVPGHSAVDFISDGSVVLMTDTALVKNQEKLRFHIRPNRLMARVLHHDGSLQVKPLKGCNLIVWRNRTWLQIKDEDFQLPPSLKVDWLIISNNACYNVEKISSIDCQKIILDSSNTFYFADKFLKAIRPYKIKAYSVLHEGAFDFKIPADS